MRARIVVCVCVVLAACKFPELPPLDDDAGDDDSGASDGAPVDVPTDADLPIVTNNQAADLVLGAANFTSIGRTGFTAISVRPDGMATDGNSLWVGDTGRERVMVWSPLPTANDAPASLALGRSSLIDSSSAPAPSLSSVNIVSGLAFGGGRLIAVDGGWSRVTAWEPLPTSNGEAADFYYGQSGPTVTGSATAAGRFRGPYGVWTDGTHLIIADTFNHRVLIWNTMPGSGATPADAVLGQTGSNAALVYDPPTSTSMTFPRDVYFDGTRLYVSDSGNNRVLVWYGIPTGFAAPADYVLGQPDFASKAPAVTATGMNGPAGIAVAGGALFVADTQNNRILIFDQIPSATGSPATYVLGQVDLFTMAGGNPTPSETNMTSPREIVVAGNKLFLGDWDNYRILRFNLNL